MPLKDKKARSEYNRKWRENHPGYMANWWRRLRLENPQKANEYERRKDRFKVYARQKKAYAVRHGKLIPPASCSSCASNLSLEAHHTDYAAALDVVWFCRACHLERHSVT